MSDTGISPLLDTRSGPRQWLRMWGVSCLVWLGLWILHHASLAGAVIEHPEKTAWPLRLTLLGDYFVSAAFVLPFLFLAWRLPLDSRRWRRSLVGLVALIIVFSAVDVGTTQLVRGALVDLHPAFRPHRMRFLSMWIFNSVVYAVVAAVGWAIQYQREAGYRQRRAAQLETRLAEARLEALRTQLQPHFLFNALNAVAALVRHDAEGAERMIARLSDLLRCSFASGGAQEVPLEQELEITERYVEIERVRFADRLTVTRSVAPETLDALVPSLILQPLVENAVRHGIAACSGPGRVEIAAIRDGEALVIAVRDDGRGFDGEPAAVRRQGVGLANTRARLAQLYGEPASLHVARRAEGGTEAILRLPWRLAEASRTQELGAEGGAVATERHGRPAAPAEAGGTSMPSLT